MVVCDVSGKGVSAALLGSILQGMVYSQLATPLSLDQIADSANKFLCQKILGEKYATIVIARLRQDGELEYINCGHVQPVIISKDGVRREVEANLPVGLLPVATYSSERIFRTYGNNRAGQVLLEDNPPQFTPDAPGYHEYVLKGTCDAAGEFRFDKVPAGDYFVMVFVIWELSGLNPPVRTGGALMKRIHVNPRANLQVELR